MTKRSIVSLAAKAILAMEIAAAPMAMGGQGEATVLQPAALEKLIPATVFYRGQTTTTQLRNSGGVEFGDGYYFLASLVDTSGYSNATAAKFQAYFITEVPIRVNGIKLGAGVYGIGFVASNKFVVTDVGGHDVVTVDSNTDSGLERLMPLQVLAQPGGSFRLYEGRRFVLLAR